MTAHVVYDAWDPERPASLSPIVIGEIIRGRIGFDGFLMSDDIGMEALAGDFGSRAAGRGRRRLRRRAPLLGQDGGNGRGRRRGSGDERREARPGLRGRWRRP